jgi:hypothetical protein
VKVQVPFLLEVPEMVALGVPDVSVIPGGSRPEETVQV